MKKIKLSEVFLLLQKHRSMIVVGDDFQDLTNFVNGYFAAINVIFELDMGSKFDDWFFLKTGIERTSLGASHHLFHTLAKNDRQKASELLLEYMVAFFDQPNETLGVE